MGVIHILHLYIYTMMYCNNKQHTWYVGLSKRTVTWMPGPTSAIRINGCEVSCRQQLVPGCFRLPLRDMSWCMRWGADMQVGHGLCSTSIYQLLRCGCFFTILYPATSRTTQQSGDSIYLLAATVVTTHGCQNNWNPDVAVIIYFGKLLMWHLTRALSTSAKWNASPNAIEF